MILVVSTIYIDTLIEHSVMYGLFLKGDTIYLLYAYNSMDPETNESTIPQHQFRQSMIVSLFGSIVEPSEPSDATNLDILADNVSYPHVECTQVVVYYCNIATYLSY